ncbi:YebC/PmpR family DNA-binding transcriptional regulator [Clostridium felsineum]|uniref:Probable transcriptional regulatory protein CROST_029230 n=1 Tax=Clostridium felsineum TaxID=36839 RepID=A0A1S8LJV3_9CLOT|nr:YebC/PmpR family DNA-binding transcriptional regulator [Clostridium felsineum]MCR3761837.1 YebC/PmpR family DNA-binding transcriptional regulator [Clostridium felsineum]URZ07177.1 putative transcriptional regulatory protein [Clostridium felsineum]URZ12206.1 putative transcriptional regulatory protein [Clostridium felsineum]URZ16799.1 putative transcriptional regulatory protein [Clostridium felsineum DSM 794]
MSGHSKWHNIQAKKGKADAKRGKIFTKIGKEIAVAVKSGGSNLDSNAKLRDCVAKAKASNMPMDTITRAIKKGAGELEGVNYEEIIYEGYGPAGVAMLVNVLTDNKNRSASDVRCSFDRSGGNLGATGCVSWMFQRKGQIVIEKNDAIDEDELMMKVLELGAEDFASDEDVFIITTTQEEFSNVREALEKENFEFVSAELTMIPDTTVKLNLDDSEKVQRLIDKLEDSDDVQDVYHNAEFDDAFEE